MRQSRDANIKLAHDLRQAINDCRDRGLLISSKWALELLNSLPQEFRTTRHLPFNPPTPRQSLDFVPSSPQFIDEDEGPQGVDMLEQDEFELARAYFELKEMERCAWALRNSTSSRGRFLRVYASYLAADRKSQEALPHFLDTREERYALTPVITPLLEEIKDDPDPWLTYLTGMLYARIDQKKLAVEYFMRSVIEQPYNWSCWNQLAQLVTSADMFIELKERLPVNHMLEFFAINVMLDLHTATDLVMKIINELADLFPTSAFLMAQRALVYYHMRDFERAEIEFDNVQRADPFRLDEVDIYSNMLYVMEKRAKLGKLAHDYAEIDRNRAEVCCLIGNYYSARSEHVKAVTYFKRSLLLNRDYLPAWTLMGHEYVELKNSHAAIEAYRRAIDVNGKDYRAWYGLGQAYELLDMPLYAIEYYNQATSLRPYDSRMWTALATVYEHLTRIPEAIQAHTRALLGADATQTFSIMLKLASLHGQTPAGVEWHRKIIALGGPIASLSTSYIAVARHEMDAPDGVADLALAAQYLNKVVQSHAAEKEGADEMLRELRLRQAGAL